MNRTNSIQSNIMQKIITISSVPPVPDLVWYKLNNNIFNYKISNLPVSDATCNGTEVYTASHLVGENCFSFSGGTTSNWINLPTLTRTTTLTFSCWINVSTFATNSRVFDYGGSFRLSIRGTNRLTFNDAYNITYSTGFQNVWKHIAFTVNGLTLTFYENGVAVLVTTMTSPLSTSPSNGFIAHSYGADVNPGGKYADFRIYGRVISNAEILSLYNN